MDLRILSTATADATQNYFPNTAGERISTLLDTVWDSAPDAVVIQSTLIPNKDAQANSNVNSINSQIRTLVSQRQAAGDKILLVDFNNGWITTDELCDKTHPIPEAYEKLAALWTQQIMLADSKRWITPPFDTGIPDNATSEGTDCLPSPDKVPKLFTIPYALLDCRVR